MIVINIWSVCLCFDDVKIFFDGLKAILSLLKSGLFCVVYKTTISMCFNEVCCDFCVTFISRTTQQINLI